MKKLSVIVAMALAVVANYSCGEYDNAVVDNGKTTIIDDNGNPYEVGGITTFEATPGQEVTVGIQIFDNEDYYALKSGDNFVYSKVDNQELTMLDPIIVGEDGVIEVLGNSNIQKLFIIGATPTNFEAEKLTNLESLTMRLSTVESLDLSAFEKLNTVIITDGKLKSIELGENYGLKVLDLDENELTSINLKNYYQLEKVNLAYNYLQNIDLANDYNQLTEFYAQDNQLTSFDATKMTSIKKLDLSNNLLEGEIDLSTSENEVVLLNNNLLTSVKVKDVTGKLDISNNMLGFDTMPLPTMVTGTYIYADQKPYIVIPVNGILDLSNLYEIDGNITTYEIDPEETEVDRLKNGRFAFPTATDGIVVTMTNESFPALTLKTIAFNTEAASNIIYSFNPETDVDADGGSIKYVHSLIGDKAIDLMDYLHFKDEYKTKGYYTAILLNGTKESIANNPYHYLQINLDEPLKKGNVLRFTGFRLTPPSETANLYLLFDLLNDNSKRLGNDYKPGRPYTFEYFGTQMFNNIWENGLVPNELILIVDEAIAGSESFKVALNDHETDIYLTKVEILRKAE